MDYFHQQSRLSPVSSYVLVLECGDYPIVVNATAQPNAEKTIGSTATLTCDGNYLTTSGQSVINVTCNFLGGVSRNWTQPNETQCYGKSLLYLYYSDRYQSCIKLNGFSNIHNACD